MPIPPIVIDVLCNAHLGAVPISEDLSAVLTMLGVIYGGGFLAGIVSTILLRPPRGTPVTRTVRAVVTTCYVLSLPIQALPLLGTLFMLGSSVGVAFQLLCIVLSLPIIWLHVVQVRSLKRLWNPDAPDSTTARTRHHDAR